MVNSKSKSGEAIGSIEETIAKTKKDQEEQIPKGVEEEVAPKPREQKEAIGIVSDLLKVNVHGAYTFRQFI